MKIAICIKHVPVSEDVEIDSVTHSVRRIDATCDMNPCDLNAMEMAAQLNESNGWQYRCLHDGAGWCSDILEEVSSPWADEAYLLSDRSFAGRDTLGTARVLADLSNANHTTSFSRERNPVMVQPGRLVLCSLNFSACRMSPMPYP